MKKKNTVGEFKVALSSRVRAGRRRVEGRRGEEGWRDGRVEGGRERRQEREGLVMAGQLGVYRASSQDGAGRGRAGLGGIGWGWLRLGRNATHVLR